ncbi:MAG: hypothetical protein AAGI07_01715 [Bacteroidota bacterium]
MKYLMFLLSIVCLFGACRTAKQNPTDFTQTEQQDEGVIFLSFKIFKDSTLKEQVELINKIWTSGTLKEKRGVKKKATEEMVEIFFFDEEKNLLKSVILENPLHAHMEYFSPEGKISTKKVDLKEAFLTIRTALSLDAAYVRVVIGKNTSSNFIELK